MATLGWSFVLYRYTKLILVTIPTDPQFSRIEYKINQPIAVELDVVFADNQVFAEIPTPS